MSKVRLKKKISSPPQKPGVYLFKNPNNKVIYIGKASNLKNRVASYFSQASTFNPAKQVMIDQIQDLDYIVTSSEIEALLLETTLIKKYHPAFNVNLKDDKYFLYVKFALEEDFPRIYLVRRIGKDKNRYFGPYPSAHSVRETLKLIKKIFPYCLNPPKIQKGKIKPNRACFQYHLGRCLGTCLGKVSKEEYRKIILQMINFFEGKQDKIFKDLKNQMTKASNQKEFEKAARLRDQIKSLEKILTQQKVVSTKMESQDILSLTTEKNLGCINVLNIREGKLIQSQNFILENLYHQTPPEIMEAFLNQYYSQTHNLPQEILIPHPVQNKKLLEKWTKTKIKIPQRGQKKHLIKLGELNAREYLARKRQEWESDKNKIRKALEELTSKLNLPKIPERIEAYDVSNIQGIRAVGSMIVFKNGQPQKSAYRKFQIKTIKGINDPGMMAEVIKRRFKHVANSTSTEWPQPNLIILDGGKSQLGVVGKTLKQLKVKIPFMALAKKEEEIFLPQKPKPITLPQNSEALFLLQRIRDEAHRFAYGYFKTKSKKEATKSLLDEIPGLGPKKKKLLLKTFGSLDQIRQAPDSQIKKLIGSKTTKILREYL